MNKQNFIQSGGFPLQTETLNEMQKAYELFNSFGNIAGNFSIISGCVVTNAQVSDGVVFINGELFEFRGGQIGTDVVIVEVVTQQEFQDGNDKDVVFVRYVTFGFGLNSIPWVNFNNISSIITLQTRLLNVEKVLNPLLSGKSWLLFERPAIEIPIGWELVTEMRGKSAVGHDPTITAFNTVGNIGGLRNFKLTENHLPEIDLSNQGFDRLLKYSGSETATVVDNLQNPGQNQPMLTDSKAIRKFGLPTNLQQEIDLMSPYRIVLYIKYVG